MNFVPFAGIPEMLAYTGSPTLALYNLAGNVVMFMPLGFLVPLLWRPFGAFWRTLVLGGSLSVGIEAAQLFTSRSTDVNDVMLNTLGAVLGWLLWRLMRALLPKFAARFYARRA